MGFGAALMFRALGQPNLAALALIGPDSITPSTMPHSRDCSFWGAGSVVHSTHTRNMEKMAADPAHAGDSHLLPGGCCGYLWFGLR